jgi:hypothetical protein
MRTWQKIGMVSAVTIASCAAAFEAYDYATVAHVVVDGRRCYVWRRNDGNICRGGSWGGMCTLGARICANETDLACSHPRGVRACVSFERYSKS